MGDGSLAFAPQWLKSGQNSLRTGTQGSTPVSKEKGSEGPSWRESGSRLGLGAGTDRDFADSKPLTSSKRHNGAFSDRSSNSHTRGTDRLGGGVRPLGQSRPLSDRELLEQTSPFRPARTDTFSPQYSSRGTPKSTQRKSGGYQSRNHGRAQDSESASGRFQSSSQQLSSVLLSPRQELRLASGSAPITVPAAELGQWTTRLADTPHEIPKPSPVLAQLEDKSVRAPLNGSAASVSGTASLPGTPVRGVPLPVSPLRGNAPSLPGSVSPLSGLGPVTPAANSALLDADAGLPKATPRMADAIANAQAIASQEAEAAKLEKQRKEQLALRQSKQLVPVLPSTKPKQTLSASGGAGLKKPSGLEGLKPGASAFITTTRKDDRSPVGVAKPQSKPLPGKPLESQGKKLVSEKSLGSRPSKEKDRLSFFSSLKSKSSQDHTNAEAKTVALPSQVLSEGKTETDILTNSSSETVSPKEVTPALQNGLVRAAEDVQLDLTDKEYAFMKSLGWEDEEDDEGGLTEEEIAAFYASSARKQVTKPLTPASKSGQLVWNSAAMEKMAKTVCGSQGNQNKLATSFHSELEFTDSDCD